MNISALEGELKVLAVDFPGLGTLNIEFRPSAFNRHLQRQMADFDALVKRKEASGEALTEAEEDMGAGFATALIAGWDLVEADGSPVPVTASVLLDRLGFIRMRRITEALVEALNPNA